jgi:acyl-CoA synthetase (AMP-forming)/AMP-acid ligase II/acetyltransferase-like isoleucine patch superfamily enzyme/acyl carrier protein
MPPTHVHAGTGSIREAPAVYTILQRSAAQFPDAVAITAPGRQPLTYRSLLNLVENIARTLRALGLNRNDRVVVVMPNGPEMAVAFLAITACTTCAPLNPAYRANEFDFFISDLRPKALLIHADLDSAVRDVAAALGITVIDVQPRSDAAAGVFDLSVELADTDIGDAYALQADTALLLHTSGTTSRPKLVPLTHENVSSAALTIAQTLQLTPNDHCLNVMPLFHIHGLVAGLLASLAVGSHVTCTPAFNADRFFEWLDASEPTWYTAVPTMHQAILAKASRYREVIARRPLRLIRSSSASLPPAVMDELERTFATQVIEAYGMTEASHQIASNPLAPRTRKPGSVGVSAGAEFAVLDNSGAFLPTGVTGEVVIRGRSVTAGYEQNVTANKAAFVAGWFRTGDLGYIDEDGYLFLKARLKEIISRGGEKIAPKEIDEILAQHPAVAQAVAFAVPHPTLGEDIAAAVVLKPNYTVGERELREFVATRVAAFKIPQQVVLLTEIPKGPTGKIQRIGLAAQLADRLLVEHAQGFQAPKTAVEVELARIWRTILDLETVGTRDSFYVLGGDSLAMATMLLEVEDRFSKAIPVDQFLITPTIETIAALLEPTIAPASRTAFPGPSTNMPIRDSLFRGLKNRLLQCVALYAPGYKSTRIWLHRMRGVSIGRNASIGLSVLIETAYPQLVSIGDNVTIGMRAIVIAHLRDSIGEARARHRHTVRIEDDVYIGPGAIILPNVTIGRGAVVSAGSVVSKSVPPRTLARGNPAEPVAHCGVSLAGGVAYEHFVKHLRPLDRAAASSSRQSEEH